MGTPYLNLVLKHHNHCWRRTDASYCVFSHDVMAAIFVSQNNETAAMFVSQTSPVGVALFSYVNASFCSINLHRCWPRGWKHRTEQMLRRTVLLWWLPRTPYMSTYRYFLLVHAPKLAAEGNPLYFWSLLAFFFLTMLTRHKVTVLRTYYLQDNLLLIK